MSPYLRIAIICPILVLITFIHSGCVIGEGFNYATHIGSGHFDSKNKQRQLERVARDWCLTIRASQVIPVYPLDEDIQVGDVYIVDTPISQLKKQWNNKGYLPIDHRFGRIHPNGYSNYYLTDQYDIRKGQNDLPKLWQFPGKREAAGFVSKATLDALQDAKDNVRDATKEVDNAENPVGTAAAKLARVTADHEKAKAAAALAESTLGTVTGAVPRVEDDVATAQKVDIDAKAKVKTAEADVVATQKELEAANVTLGTAGDKLKTANDVLKKAIKNYDDALDKVFKDTNWPRAPRAGFPSYTFKVKASEGFSGAIPVSGVPIALSAMAAREATGSVVLTDAFTYGIDESSLRKNLFDWLDKNQFYLEAYGPDKPTPNNAVIALHKWGEPGPLRTWNQQLAEMGKSRRIKKAQSFTQSSKEPKKRYLRLVTRVYLVRAVNVSVTNTSNSAWRGSAGEPKPLNNIPTNITADTDLASLLAEHKLQTGAVAVGTAPDPTADTTANLDARETKLNERETKLREREKNADTPGEKASVEQERKLLLQERQLLHDERQRELERQRKVFAQKKTKEDFNDSAYKRALKRAESKDRFGGHVVPGGTVQMTSASSRSVSLKETFPRPLVVGYHALEFAILEGGRLSARPVSTFNRLDQNLKPSEIPYDRARVDEIKREFAGNADLIMDRLIGLSPDDRKAKLKDLFPERWEDLEPFTYKDIRDGLRSMPLEVNALSREQIQY